MLYMFLNATEKLSDSDMKFDNCESGQNSMYECEIKNTSRTPNFDNTL